MADSICWCWLPAGASRQRGNEPSQALRASSPEGGAKAVEGALPASLLKGCQGRNGSASCLSLWERWLRPSGADGEGAPAPCGELPPQRLRGLQIGEARKKCNGDDRRQRRMQGGAVGAAACRMRVPPKARSRRRVPQPVGSSASKSLRPCRAEHAAFASQTGLRLKSPTGAFMPSGHRRPFWFSFVRQKRTSSSGEAFPRKSEAFPLCAENISFSPPFYTKGCFLSN